MQSAFPTSDPISVLVVEDDPLHARLLDRMLAAKGFGVTLARNGREALEALRAQGHPLVITDWNMPEMDGLELCRRIRNSDEIPFTYIILLTGNATTEQIVAGFEAGADDYVTKPFVDREVLSRLRAAERIIRLEAFHRKHTVLLHKVNAEVAVLNGELERMTRGLREARDEAVSARTSAESANRAKSRFLANMGHEIRTPLTAILGFVDVLAEASSPGSAGAVFEESLEVIRRNGEDLLEMLDDLLDFSRMESGALHVERVPFCLPALLESVATVMRVRAQAKNVDLVVECDPATPRDILGDPTRLRQVLLNLVGNALKFTRKGSVRIAAGPWRDDPSEGVALSVIDTGVGIPADHFSGIFEPFAQADSSVTRRFGGTGLGLSICKRLVEAMGGSIEVESAEGTGSRFTVRLPVERPEAVVSTGTEASQAAAKEAPPAPAPNGVLDGLRILLAEDGEDNRRLVQHLLSRLGARMKLVEHGKQAVDEALQAWRTGSAYDVVLMDMQMPIMDGYSATHTLRESGYDGPVIALTAHAMAEDRETCLAAGCDEYVSKPIDIKKLLAAIRTVRPSMLEAPS